MLTLIWTSQTGTNKNIECDAASILGRSLYSFLTSDNSTTSTQELKNVFLVLFGLQVKTVLRAGYIHPADCFRHSKRLIHFQALFVYIYTHASQLRPIPVRPDALGNPLPIAHAPGRRSTSLHEVLVRLCLVFLLRRNATVELFSLSLTKPLQRDFHVIPGKKGSTSIPDGGSCLRRQPLSSCSLHCGNEKAH